MKKLYSIITYFIIISGTVAQGFKVAEINCNYKTVNHNFNFSCVPYQNASATYSVDVNADLIPDITVGSSCQWVFSSSCACYVKTCKIDFIGSTNNFQFVWDGMGGIKNLASGTVLDNSFNWGGNGGYLYGSYTNPYYIGFRKILSGDTLYGWMSLNHDCPGGINSYSYKLTSDTVNIPSVFSTPSDTICSGTTLTLSASPGGGNFTGQGVTGNLFSSLAAGTGTFALYYNSNPLPGYCANSSSISITVNPNMLPPIVFSGQPYITCTDTLPINVTPIGGTLTGTGLSGNAFVPQLSGFGQHIINYTVNDIYGCTRTSTTSVSVYSTATVNSISTLCAGESITLSATPSGGIYSGQGMIGNVFLNMQEGVFPVVYSYTNTAGCLLKDTVDINNQACFRVGATNCNIKIINHSFPAIMSVDSTYSHNLDLDGDMINDCRVEWRWKYGSPYWNDLRGLNFIPLNSSTYFSFAGTACYTLNLIKYHPAGTSISNTFNWMQSGGTEFYSYWTNSSANVTCGKGGAFYIAYKKQLSNDTVTGWISGNMYYYPPDSTGPTINAVGFTGRTFGPCVGINEWDKIMMEFNLYPNPANENLYLETDYEMPNESFQVNLISIEGRKILTKYFNGRKAELETGSINAGIYIVEIKNKEFVSRKKVIITH